MEWIDKLKRDIANKVKRSKTVSFKDEKSQEDFVKRLQDLVHESIKENVTSNENKTPRNMRDIIHHPVDPQNAEAKTHRVMTERESNKGDDSLKKTNTKKKSQHTKPKGE